MNHHLIKHACHPGQADFQCNKQQLLEHPEGSTIGIVWSKGKGYDFAIIDFFDSVAAWIGNSHVGPPILFHDSQTCDWLSRNVG